MVTGVTYYLQTWVIEKKGPVFLAMSTPLVLIITTFASATILGEIISLGRYNLIPLINFLNFQFFSFL